MIVIKYITKNRTESVSDKSPTQNFLQMDSSATLPTRSMPQSIVILNVGGVR